MSLANATKLIGILIISLGIILACRLMPNISTEESTSEKDRIIANLKDEQTLPGEVARIKEIRQTQIQALLYVITDFQQGLREDRACLRSVPAEESIKLLGCLRADESIEFLISFAGFIIEEDGSPLTLMSTDRMFSQIALRSALQNSLVQIGNPAIEPLITSLKNDVLRTHFPKGLTEEGKKMVEKDETHKFLKYQFARMTLYRIEGDCAIHRLEKAFSEETNKQKKENIAQAITKMREEIKTGVYDKLLEYYKIWK